MFLCPDMDATDLKPAPIYMIMEKLKKNIGLKWMTWSSAFNQLIRPGIKDLWRKKSAQLDHLFKSHCWFSFLNSTPIYRIC